MGNSILDLSNLATTSPLKTAWHNEYRRGIRAMINEHLWVPDATFYISATAAGGGDGTINSPMTQAEANTARASISSSAVEFLLASGSYRIASAQFGDAEDIAYTRWRGYGTTRPYITTAVAHTSGWTLDSGTRYYKAAAAEPRVIYRADRWWNCFFQAETAADASTVKNTLTGCDGAWFWDSGNSRIYIDCGADPNTLALEIVAKADLEFFTPTADMISFWNLNLIGGGAYATASSEMLIDFKGDGAESCLIKDCDFFGGWDHAVGGTGANTGGLITFINVKAGGGSYLNNDVSAFIFANTNGNGQAIFHNCQTPVASLPHHSWYKLAQPLDIYIGQCIRAHTTNSGTFDYLVEYNDPGTEQSPDRYFATGTNSSFSNTATPSNTSDYSTWRALSFFQKMTRTIGRLNTNSAGGAIDNKYWTAVGGDTQLFIGRHLYARVLDTDGRLANISPISRTFCSIFHVIVENSSGNCRFWNAGSGATQTGQFERCAFIFENANVTCGLSVQTNSKIVWRDGILMYVNPGVSQTLGSFFEAVDAPLAKAQFWNGLLIVNHAEPDTDFTAATRKTNSTTSFDITSFPYDPADQRRTAAGTTVSTIEYDLNLRPFGTTPVLGPLSAFTIPTSSALYSADQNAKFTASFTAA